MNIGLLKKSLWSLALLTCFVLCFGFSPTASAQDLQFSQFHNAPLYLNPAFAGMHQGGRMTLNYRNQWPSLGVNYITYAGGFDYYFPNIRSSIGIVAKVDEQTTDLMSYKTTDVSLIYAYMIPLSDRLTVQPALQVGYVQKSAGFIGLTYPDQFTNRGLTGLPTAESFARNQLGYVDISTGAVLFGQNFWIGLSANHINSPPDSFIGDNNRLPMKISLHGGYKIDFAGRYDDRAKSITPNFMYKKQGSFQQITIGANGEYSPLLYGLWYRGFPIEQSTNNFPKHDAVVAMMGVKFGGWALAYSYDWSISEVAGAKANTHEISLVYSFGGKDGVDCPNPFSEPRFKGARYR
ncbi:Bacteroidetes-specific putative membrane protein [Bernardetia litoralis DSM 6794]|uniref:Bacteroidetes-specific putative membrane protein n=1 Tax=Bernardetia litoralis (strain ATCC 23117 / DSM 6794 / NBRC 15988 / NCIMB 1366 / Fx l1 / Sio-4) TaxID=880071 RepID=I4ANZ3_BERLS|nr:PorP/SprF family type IX secretion system membrane protein [Bernardetia litoralis]AFM05678.1 Bacteroidetes-specific putative membrane protein [Bernardetia litoralis DSM 6794]